MGGRAGVASLARSVAFGALALSSIGCNAITASGRSSNIGLLATAAPAGHLLILKREVEGIDCPGDGQYADYGKAIDRAIASVRGANILTNVTLSSATDSGLGGVGICVRAVGSAGRLE